MSPDELAPLENPRIDNNNNLDKEPLYEEIGQILI